MLQQNCLTLSIARKSRSKRFQCSRTTPPVTAKIAWALSWKTIRHKIIVRHDASCDNCGYNANKYHTLDQGLIEQSHARRFGYWGSARAGQRKAQNEAGRGIDSYIPIIMNGTLYDRLDCRGQRHFSQLLLLDQWATLSLAHPPGSLQRSILVAVPSSRPALWD